MPTHLCNCGAIATHVTTWRTPVMKASSFWYDCAACLAKTQKVLASDPNATFQTRPLAEQEEA